jgi:VCBS repeat-containing protein
MAKLYKVIVNAKGTEAKEVKVLQGASEKGNPVHIDVTRDMRLELQDVAKGSNLAPDQVRLKRMGKNLWLYFDGSDVADVVLDDYYNNDSDAKGSPPVLAGYAENGEAYEYIPQDPEVSSLSGALKEGNVPVIMSLGGGALGEFELSALPLVAAAGGGFGGLLLGGAALAAAALGGGKGGTATVVPSGQTGHLTHDAVNDTGRTAAEQQDSYTRNTNPQLTITAEHGATVVVTVNGKDYTATETATSGVYTVNVGSKETAGKLTDGVYTPIIKVTNAAGTSSANGEAFTIDSSDSTNQDAKKSPSTQNDDNHNATVNTTSIVSIDTDTGVSATDFNTSDNTLTFTGQVKGFIANGDLLHVQVVKSDGTVAIDTYVTPSATGAWSLDNTSKTLENGSYTIKATLEDLAGNPVNPTVTHALVIESVAPTPTPLPTNPTLVISSITDDTGVSNTDFKTSDNTLTIQGTTNLPADSTVQVYVEVLQGTTVVRSGYATKSGTAANPSWSFVADADNGSTVLADGNYTIQATYKTAAGNALGVAATKTLVVEHVVPTPTPLPSDATLVISSITDDTGVSNTDFKTSDNTLTIQGTTNLPADSTVQVYVEVLQGTTVVRSGYATKSGTAANPSWSFVADADNGSTVLADGNYTIQATYKTAAGNALGVAVTKTLVVEHVVPTPTPLPSGTELSITGITDDTGTSGSDFKTSDHTLTISGATNLPVGSTVQIYVQVLAADGHTVVRSGYATIDTSHTTWTFVADANGATTSLPNGSYTITASYRTAAGNDLNFHAVDHDLFIADSNADTLQVVADTASVTEGAPLTTTVATGVLANDGDTLATSLVVTKVEKGASIDSSASPVASAGKTTKVGEYGQLDMFADGHYVYTPDGHLKAGQTGVDHFSYEATAGTDTSARSKTTTLDITVTGVDDAASITLKGVEQRPIADGSGGEPSVASAIIVTDKDSGQSALFGFSTTEKDTKTIGGSFGNLVIATEADAGHYKWNYAMNTTNDADTVKHDLFTLQSLDKSDSTTLDFQIAQATGTTAKNHIAQGHIGDLDKLTMGGSSQLTLDFTMPSAAVNTTDTVLTANSVERIDITGAAVPAGDATTQNTIKLSLKSLAQADVVDGHHRLYINGDSNDTVDFSGVTAYSLDTPTRVVDNITYHVYHIGNDELLVQSTIANITVHS